MRNRAPEIVICFVVVCSIAIIYLVTQVLHWLVGDDEPIPDSFKASWLFTLALNVLGYATILLPGAIIFKYVKASKYLDRAVPGCFPALVRTCFTGTEKDILIGSELPSSSSTVRTLRQEALLLMFCFIGLQGSYLTWGLLQEKVMTQEYSNSQGQTGHFKDSQFLVFVNRILAFALSGVYIISTRQPRHSMPLYKYIYCSFSNIMSSWCQYEALKFVSFPTQVLAKASKIIPVMIMGKIVSREKYEFYEYVTAGFISLGMAMFLFGSSDNDKETVTTFSGVILLGAYMVFDSFTSNWQSALFKQYSMSSVQMMCGVNLFSCIFTATSLAQQSGFVHSLQFMSKFPMFTIDCMLLSISSAAGQLFIFYTIANFGPVVFVIIMTIRQGLAILLSCVIYQHSITFLGVLGVIVIFAAVFLRIYCNQRIKAHKRRLQNAAATKI
ncbi:adenosine 3'-phospho 5'-phosphosulfate transporter 1-like [Macrosteles quadrilineatus]|uniref:adenosine 3'-phospho 5'-phosphosulfate transporter 1-like n=1 Tax=Macrosteles quadrilineatus TaxID=74068 RepID=UPI0023E09ADA|nr:adenosine 3'-phospho 5'-phosphosulfate transporter 1-like [Macrosteles quadrilineatus]